MPMAKQNRQLYSDGDGDGWNSKPRMDSETDLDITPMIDVTFLLLIFFMVTSTMQASPDLDVPPAEHGVGTESGNASIIVIKAPASAAATPEIGLGDAHHQENPNASLEQVRAYVEDGLKNNKPPKEHVIIKADREVPHGFVQKVTRVVNEVEGITFSIGVRDKTN